MADVEWFYVDSNGEQAGPVSIAELKVAWSKKALTDASLVWKRQPPRLAGGRRNAGPQTTTA